ncbi:hypothetical protein M2146_001040 [Lachnospiraceae bacterium PF1-22]
MAKEITIYDNEAIMAVGEGIPSKKNPDIKEVEVLIGQETNGEAVKPFSEKVYDFLVPSINKGTYTTNIELGAMPQLVLSFDNALIDTNDNMTEFKDAINKVFEKLSETNLNALTEALQTIEDSGMKAAKVNILMYSVLDQLQKENRYKDIQLNKEFFYLSLKEFVEKKKAPNPKEVSKSLNEKALATIEKEGAMLDLAAAISKNDKESFLKKYNFGNQYSWEALLNEVVLKQIREQYKVN